MLLNLVILSPKGEEPLLRSKKASVKAEALRFAQGDSVKQLT
jgi:hypothetical protein